MRPHYDHNNDIPNKGTLKPGASSTYQLYNPTFFPFDQSTPQMSISNASLPRLEVKPYANSRGSLHRGNISSLNSLRVLCGNVDPSTNDCAVDAGMTDVDYVMEDVRALSAELKEFPAGAFRHLERIGFTDFGSVS